MGISWGDRVSNTEVLCRADMPGIEALIMKAQLWPLGRYKDSLKTSLEACGISTRGWESLASDRGTWCPAVQKGVRLFDEKRFKSLD
uniref:Uncharacterized protein n=1 Tax=Octopus bimaculoides TaxID=37653 RepID=A0A0L8GYU2_OCTBM